MAKVGTEKLRKQQLIDATIKSIESHGFQGTTIMTISREAQMSAGIISHYFGNKQGLVLATIRHLLEQLKQGLLQQIAQGEVCTNGTRFFVQKDIYPQFSEQLKQRTEQNIIVGDPTDPETNFGALISKKHQELVLSYIHKGKEEGATDWDYAHCLPYFKKAETWAFADKQPESKEYRGTDGPLGVNNGNEMKNPLFQAFVDAGVQAGYMETADYNAQQQEGFGPMHMTVKNGVRWSAANAYLKPALSRPNLTVVTHALVHKVLLSTDNGNKSATEIRYERKEKMIEVSANKEVILSAGSIGSPHLLQLSVIGAKETLERAGIECLHDLPGVDENLQDHLEFYF